MPMPEYRDLNVTFLGRALGNVNQATRISPCPGCSSPSELFQRSKRKTETGGLLICFGHFSMSPDTLPCGHLLSSYHRSRDCLIWVDRAGHPLIVRTVRTVDGEV